MMKRPFCPKKMWWVLLMLLVSAVLGVAAAGCGQKENEVMTGIRFDRGHGSAWGNQFYIEVCADEIVLARYFPENARDQKVCEHIPITPEQWNEICELVQAMDLKENRVSLWQLLWKNRKLDGGEYRALTVIWDENVEIAYQWPDNQQAKDLEALLEQLAVTSEGG